MTPVEIFEYKQKWMMSGDNNPVTFHSDWRSQAVEFCKLNFETYQYKHYKYTENYEDTMYFEHSGHSEFFSDYMKITQNNR